MRSATYRILRDSEGPGTLFIHGIIDGTHASGTGLKATIASGPDLWRHKPAEIQRRT